MKRKANHGALIDQVRTAIRVRKLLNDGERVLVAVSGGLDSVVLLHVLRELSHAKKWGLVVAHFNHNLRGAESDGDQRFIEKLCRKLRVRCISGAGDVSALASREGISIEMAARQARHAFLAMTARAFGIRTIALAHHADDQIELFFVRLFRGAGSSGIAGMEWESVSPEDSKITLIRPLLGHTRAELEAFAATARLQYREDSSNACTDMLRNRVRHKLLPLIRRQFGDGVAPGILRTMDIVGAEGELISQMALAWRKNPNPSFAELSVALQRRILQDSLLKIEVTPAFELIEWLRLNPSVKISWREDIALCSDRDGKVRRVEDTRAAGAAPKRIQLSTRGNCTFGSLRIAWRIHKNKQPHAIKRTTNREHFDADVVGAEIVLRHWQPGDRFQPSGMVKPVKLQDLFTNNKVPREKRHTLVIAESANGQIFWVEGLRISETFKLSAKAKRILEWRWSAD